jgi:hypothetical protein
MEIALRLRQRPEGHLRFHVMKIGTSVKDLQCEFWRPVPSLRIKRYEKKSRKNERRSSCSVYVIVSKQNGTFEIRKEKS